MPTQVRHLRRSAERRKCHVVRSGRGAPASSASPSSSERLQAGVVTAKNKLVKVLGQGELPKAITVHAHKFSKSAQEKIEKAGGRVQVL